MLEWDTCVAMKATALKFDKLPPDVCTCIFIVWFIFCLHFFFEIFNSFPFISRKRGWGRRPQVNYKKTEWQQQHHGNKNDKHHKHVNNNNMNMNVDNTTYPCDHHPFLFWRFNCWIFISVTRIKWILFNAIISLSANTWINEHKLEEQHKPMDMEEGRWCRCAHTHTHTTNTNTDLLCTTTNDDE